MKKVLFLLLVPAQIFIFSSKVWAVETPQYPSCSSPNGTVLATYQDGTHGVPGDGRTYTGQDTVYQLNPDLILQCLCPPDTVGVQTNWWRNPQLSENDMKVLVREGWIYVPNGALWGLDGVPYLAKNSNYDCRGRGGVGSSSSSVSSVLGSSNSGNGGIGGAILGVSTLAGTGTSRQVIFFLVGGFSLLVAARKLRTLSRQ